MVTKLKMPEEVKTQENWKEIRPRTQILLVKAQGHHDFGQNNDSCEKIWLIEEIFICVFLVNKWDSAHLPHCPECVLTNLAFAVIFSF